MIFIKVPVLIFLIFFLSVNIFSQNVSVERKSQDEEIADLNKKVDDLSERIRILEEGYKKISALKISGFFDVYISNQKNKPNVFQTGGLELDLAHNYSNNFNVAAAIVVNEDAYLKAGFIDYTLFGQSVASRGSVFLEKGIHLQVGQFDIPFGNDWEYFPAPERITFSSPLTTELIMDEGYNDSGIRILAGFTSINLSAYMVRGIDKKESYGGNSYGGRIGLTPFNNPYMLSFDRNKRSEIGFSYIYDVDSAGAKSEEAFAIDFNLRTGYIFLRSEYVLRKNVLEVEERGYHITGGIDFKRILSIPVIVFARYDYYQILNDTTATYDESTGNDELDDVLEKFTLGINLNISNISYIKLEYSRSFSNDERFTQDEYYTEKEMKLQLVIRF